MTVINYPVLALLVSVHCCHLLNVILGPCAKALTNACQTCYLSGAVRMRAHFSLYVVMLFEDERQEALYRSSLRDVTNMLRSKHGDNYLVSHIFIASRTTNAL